MRIMWKWRKDGNHELVPVEDRPPVTEEGLLKERAERILELENEIAGLRQQVVDRNSERIAVEKKLEELQSALRPLVLRLKVLDIDAIAEKEGDGGMLPMRMMISELKALVAAWDGKMPSPFDAYGQTYTTVVQPYGVPSALGNYSSVFGSPAAGTTNTYRLP